MNRSLPVIQALLSILHGPGEILNKISNNTSVPPLAFRPGMHVIRDLATNRTHTLFVVKSRKHVLIRVEK